MNTLANKVHTDQELQEFNKDQHFASASEELKIGNTRITGYAGKTFQLALTTGGLAEKLRKK